MIRASDKGVGYFCGAAIPPWDHSWKGEWPVLASFDQLMYAAAVSLSVLLLLPSSFSLSFLHSVGMSAREGSGGRFRP